jgi:hypothetical protein
MFMAKAIAAFVMTVITGVTASDIAPFTGTVHLVMTLIAVVATAVVTYAVPNRGTTVVDRVVN